ncbi:MAG: hypothetical protein HYS81_00685 [Candidatus Aenigmatarchaeota archaeon]|nr:MAG: hypothetical protein HYS81_00685 [Candidatus Aenigmarchaeota archaeon]
MARLKTITLRDIPLEQAKTEILEYVQRKKRVWTSEIVDDLALDLLLTATALEELEKERKIERKDDDDSNEERRHSKRQEAGLSV